MTGAVLAAMADATLLQGTQSALGNTQMYPVTCAAACTFNNTGHAPALPSVAKNWDKGDLSCPFVQGKQKRGAVGPLHLDSSVAANVALEPAPTLCLLAQVCN